ncbi:SbcC-like subunit of palindrome specific endonuclease [Bacillus phage Pascal]|uniref:Nucleoside triphosphate hydrolase n=1 Tax=Bacillus phage Pascal TaxID=1540092 RepID=A0A0A0RNI0_9CAUD|nr:SbcC-like subunit of palindrome specific endonuclease [Bacillus phage Pascal]AIW03665.1 nucleoside triphosphate hydrolase [Bacillus phage Pascal]
MTKSITLQSLVLLNFKGIRELKLQLNNANADIFGDNATGKTTINDGVTWLLFDKDSLNRKDFQFKTVDSQNNEIHNLEHSVEGIFSVDGAELSLKKIFKEKWTKKRGAATAEFTGHTTDYFINGVPSKKGEYTNKVAELVNEDTFKLLTTPTFFNEHMKWQDRRNVLMEIAGDLSDAEVIASSDKLKALEAILNSHSIADHRKMIASKKTTINKELNAIPVRIDEVRRSMVDTNGASEEALQENIKNAQDKVNVQNETILHLQNGGGAHEIKQQIEEQRSLLLQAKNEYSEKNYTSILDQQELVRQSNEKVSNLTIELKQAQTELTNVKNFLAKEEEKLAGFRSEWSELDAQTFDEHKNTCTMCGQEFPEEKRLELVDAFNLHKAEQLEKLVKQGKSSAAEVENTKVVLSNKEKNIFAIETELKEAVRVKEEAVQKHAELKANTTPFEQTGVYTSFATEINNLTTKMNDVKSMAAESIQTAQNQINDIKQYIASQEAVLNQIKQNEASEKRIAELEEQQQQLAEEYEKIEHQLFLTEEFIRTKVNLLEEKINNKFKMAKFKLFETQINGAIIECCETLYNGVEYNKGLNNAARINVGLDIINTLSEHYGVRVPIFVDNAEAVTELMNVDTQLIALRVNEADKKLRVEVKS